MSFVRAGRITVKKKMSSSPRVLVLAEAANPEWVSVPLVGWSLAQALREVADVHVVTHLRNRAAFLRAGLREEVDFTVLATDAIARPAYRVADILSMGKGKGWTMNTAINGLAYPYFERLVWQRFGTEIRAGAYDIVHRITPLSPTINSSIASRCAAADVPFVLGPLNGGVPWPKGFETERRREKEWLSYVRAAYKLKPGRQAMLRATSVILTGSRFTQSEIPDRFQNKTIYVPENAIDPIRFTKLSAQDVSGPLRGCFVGRLVPYKGPDMLLEAARPMLVSGQLQIDIVGDGPMRADLEAQVQRDGTAEAVQFHGNLPHDRVQDVLAQANLMTFPSIREFGGGVVLEAMALGVVPVVVDYAGPGELVSPGIGFKVPIGSRDEVIAGFRQTLQDILDNPAALSGLAAAARERVQQHFTWQAKATQIMQVYDWVRAGSPEQPPQLIPD